MKVNARGRAREAMRRELADTAFDHLLEHGYEKVSVEELAQVLGVSRATFFRYFESKEDIVVEAAAPAEPDFKAAVSLTDDDHNSPTETVIQLLAETLPAPEHQDRRLRARVRMISGNPTLGARVSVRRGARQHELTEVLADQLGERAETQIIVALGFACLDLAWRNWASGEGEQDIQHHFADIVRRAKVLFQS